MEVECRVKMEIVRKNILNLIHKEPTVRFRMMNGVQRVQDQPKQNLDGKNTCERSLEQVAWPIRWWRLTVAWRRPTVA